MRLDNLFSAIALGTLVCTAVHAGEAIAFKGTTFGVDPERFVKLHPEFKCPHGSSPLLYCRSSATTYAGVEGRTATATFVQHALSHVELSVVKDTEEYKAIYAFGTIEEALIAKHGEPKRVKDRIGDLERIVSIWHSDGLSIQLSRAKNQHIHRVGVMIGRDDHWQRSVEHRKSTAKGDI